MSRERLVVLLAAGALVLAAAASTLSSVLFVHLENEGKVRRNATCTSFERAWQTEVKNLTNTYEYLDNLSPGQLRTPLNVAVLHSVPGLEQAVHNDRPPAYCKTAGLDDTKFLPLPKRPRDLPITP